MLTQPVHILLVEDDDVDAEAVVRAFKKQKINNPFTIVHDGIEALNALRGAGGQRRVPRPYLILLDINMPRMNGLEFLQQLRQDPTLRRSVVFVLTTSRRDEDIMSAYDEQIAGYILKSKAGEHFTHLINMLDAYWRVVEFPVEMRLLEVPAAAPPGSMS
ncbi:MAG: response regulator, partial [Chloroflexota bacterium]|nr:response regulator [Chloroflexota bacterium]